LGQPVGILGVLDLGQAVGSVHNGSVAAGVLTGELVAVQAVSDGLTDVLAVSGELAAVKLDLAVAVAVEGGVVGNAFLHQVQAGVDGVGAAALVQQVNAAGLQLVHHGVAGNGADDQGLDNGLDAAVIAHVVGADGQGSLLGSLVKAGEQVGAAGDLRVVAVAGVDVVDGLLQQLSGEVTGDLSAVLGVLHIAARGDDSHRAGTDAGVGDVVVVGQLLGLDGDREGHIVDQTHAGKGVGGAVVELVVADQDGVGVA